MSPQARVSQATDIVVRAVDRTILNLLHGFHGKPAGEFLPFRRLAEPQPGLLEAKPIARGDRSGDARAMAQLWGPHTTCLSSVELADRPIVPRKRWSVR